MKILGFLKMKKVMAGLGLLVGALVISGAAFADDSNLGAIASDMTSSFGGLGKLFWAAAYIMGTGFALIAVLKFKAHKDNPQQTTLGVPVALLAIGVALIFMPSLLGSTGATIFGDSRTATGFNGEGYNASLSSGS